MVDGVAQINAEETKVGKRGRKVVDGLIESSTQV